VLWEEKPWASVGWKAFRVGRAVLEVWRQFFEEVGACWQVDLITLGSRRKAPVGFLHAGLRSFSGYPHGLLIHNLSGAHHRLRGDGVEVESLVGSLGISIGYSRRVYVVLKQRVSEVALRRNRQRFLDGARRVVVLCPVLLKV